MVRGLSNKHRDHLNTFASDSRHSSTRDDGDETSTSCSHPKTNVAAGPRDAESRVKEEKEESVLRFEIPTSTCARSNGLTSAVTCNIAPMIELLFSSFPSSFSPSSSSAGWRLPRNGVRRFEVSIPSPGGRRPRPRHLLLNVLGILPRSVRLQLFLQQPSCETRARRLRRH